MTAFKEYTADEILTEVLAYGFWWIDEDEDVQDIEHDTVIFADGRRARLTGTACRNAWDAFAAANPNAWLVKQVKAGHYDIDAEVAGVMAQVFVFGDVVYG